MTTPFPFQEVVDALTDESKPFSPRYLHLFSDLSTANLDLLRLAWSRIPLTRKQSLLEDLEILAETDTLVNFDDLGKMLLSDPDGSIRALAIRLLWECNDKKMVPLYLSILQEDADPQARSAAAGILGNYVYLGELEEIPSELHHTIEEQLLAVIRSDRDSSVRQTATESLGFSSRDDIVPVIAAAYEQKDPAWKVSALSAMGRSNDQRWKKNILSQLTSPDEDVRVEAIHASGELELGAARSVLLDQLADEEEKETRHELIWTLSKIGGEGVRIRLEELLEMEEEDDEAEFIQEALDNLYFSENMGELNLLNVDPEQEFLEERTDE